MIPLYLICMKRKIFFEFTGLQRRVQYNTADGKPLQIDDAAAYSLQHPADLTLFTFPDGDLAADDGVIGKIVL